MDRAKPVSMFTTHTKARQRSVAIEYSYEYSHIFCRGRAEHKGNLTLFRAVNLWDATVAIDINTVINIIATAATVIGSVLGLGYWLGRKITALEYRFRVLEERFKAIDERFKAIDERFESLKLYIDTRFNEVDKRFSDVDRRFSELKDYVDKRFNELKEYVDNRFNELDKRVGSRIRRLAMAFTNYQEFFIEFLSMEGIVKDRDKEMLVKESKRVMRLAVANPLTKEEWERLKELFEKSERDELTLEEADEFLELARKVVVEYGEYIEAWKLHLYATIVRALTYKKYYEKKQEQGILQAEQGSQSSSNK